MLFRSLITLPPIITYEPEYIEPPQYDASPDSVNIENNDDVWIVEGPWLERVVRNINFSDYESRMFFEKTLNKSGLYERLEEMGIKEGDTVSIYNLEFEYKK